MTGAELEAARKAAGLSRAEMARRAGIDPRAVGYWERRPHVDRHGWAVRRMSQVLGLPEPPQERAPSGLWQDSAFARYEAAAASAAAKLRVICGAKTRKGTPCRGKSEPGKRRCRFHGGKSTGPRTAEGLERIREANCRRSVRLRAERATAGHGAPCGDPVSGPSGGNPPRFNGARP